MEMRRLVSILSASAFILATAWGNEVRDAGETTAPADTSILTSAAQVRALKPEEAARRLPIRLQGVVLLRNDISLTVIDQTAGVFVECAPLTSPKVKQGDQVEIIGFSDPGKFAPYVKLVSAKKLGVAELPPPQAVSYADLMTGQFDDQWVEVSGVVRHLRKNLKDDELAELWLMTSGGLLPIRLTKKQALQALVDSGIRARGICFYQFNQAGQVLNPVLTVPVKTPIEIMRMAPDNPYTTAVIPLKRLMQFNLDEVRGHRVHVQGIVTHVEKEKNLFWLRDDQQGARVSTLHLDDLEVGARVDVLGFVMRGGYTPCLTDAVFLKKGIEPAPAPIRLSGTAQAFENDANLIEIEASIQSLRVVLDGCQLALVDGEVEFTATLQTLSEKSKIRDWLPGSRVSVKGICSVNMGALEGNPGILKPQSFRVILRSTDDLRMIQHPSWWTLEHIAWLLGTVVLLLLVILGIVFLIGRNRLRMAAINRIKAEAEFSAVWNERNRMARELHDTLAQGLGAISIQLEVVKRKIPSDSDARKALDEARALARSNLADARRAIWNMRSQVLETGDLAKALGDILKSLTANKKTKGLLRLSGQARRLAPITENNLLRIGQECIVNAVNHADAQTIDVHLEFAELYVKLTISDDGRGFDIEHPPTSEGGFGLSTIRERTEQMHGTLSLTSQPGKGTNVHVTVPTRI